jgi:hypothetical protein
VNTAILCQHPDAAFCPWRDIHDVISGYPLYEVAMSNFISEASPNIISIKDSINSYHQCSWNARQISRIIQSL